MLSRDAVSEHVIDGCVRIDAGGRCANAGDGLTVEMILVLVGNQDDVGLWKLVVVGGGLHAEANRIDLYLCAVVIDFNTGVLDARERYFLAALGGELVHFLGSLAADEGHRCCANQQLFLHIGLSVTFNDKAGTLFVGGVEVDGTA